MLFFSQIFNVDIEMMIQTSYQNPIEIMLNFIVVKISCCLNDTRSIAKNFYNANPRPDALMKDQIVDMSGLSPRVIRVWFQNKRCKDKKNQIKREMQEKNTTYDVMQGIPMVAQSPVRQSSPCQELNVFSYQPPWTALSEYGMQIDLRNDEINLDNKPTFQRLINQMHGYDDINMVNLSTYAHNQIHISSVPNDKYQYNNLQYLNNSDSSATLPDSDNSNETS